MTDDHGDGVSVIKLLRDIGAGVDAHSMWLKQLHRVLICGTPPESNDLSLEAHRHCAFGRWFYNEGFENISPWADLREGIESTHRSMHMIASALVAKWQAAKPISPFDYDAFIDAAIIFKSELRALQFRIMTDVCLVDHLTGAWNRNSMFQKIADEMERVVRNKQLCCLSIFDLDHFKDVNDRYGHAAGDKVLHFVVEHVRKYLRKYDSIFRYGGEEFLLCLPNSTVADAVAAMDRIRNGLEAFNIPLSCGDTICITASFGVAPMSAERSIEENINVADQALFCAKVSGRNRVCLWGAEDGLD